MFMQTCYREWYNRQCFRTILNERRKPFWNGNLKLRFECHEIGNIRHSNQRGYKSREERMHLTWSDQIRSVAQSVRLSATPWIAARQASLSITSCRSSLRLTSIESVISSSVVPFSSCPQSLPASESFLMSQLFAWGGQSTRVSALASFLPKKSKGWSPSQWTGWISLQSKGLSRVFSNTQFKSINSSALSLLHSPTLTSIHDHRKNHSFD